LPPASPPDLVVALRRMRLRPPRFELRCTNVRNWRKGGQHMLNARFSHFDRAARLAAIPAGESPANRRSPVTVVVISSDGEGDRSVESLEVKVPEGWSVPV